MPCAQATLRIATYRNHKARGGRILLKSGQEIFAFYLKQRRERETAL